MINRNAAYSPLEMPTLIIMGERTQMEWAAFMQSAGSGDAAIRELVVIEEVGHIVPVTHLVNPFLSFEFFDRL